MNAPTGPVGGNTTQSQRHQGLELSNAAAYDMRTAATDGCMAEK
jgi:hypothetical protein